MKRTIKGFGIIFALLLAASICLAIALPAQATSGTDYYVAVGGVDDPGSGSQGSPWATIQYAITQAVDGDRIHVAAGEYAGAIVDKNVSVSGEAAGSSIITSGVPYKEDDSGHFSAFRPEADGAEIRNFTINCDPAPGIDLPIYAVGVNYVTVDSLIINDDGALQGITNWGGSHWVITNNIITKTVASGGGGIGIFLGAKATQQCVGNLVQFNQINATATAETYSCPGICLSFDTRYGGYELIDGSEDISGNQILGNTITATGVNNGVGIEVGTILGDSETDPLRTDPDAIAAIMAAAAVKNNTVQGNTIDGAETGIYFYNATTLTLNNNNISNSIEDGIYAEHGQNGAVITGNTFAANDVQVLDDSLTLDIADILASNSFDLAVTVDHPTTSLLPAIWSKVQDGIDAAFDGDTVYVAAGDYPEGLLIDKPLSIIGDGPSSTFVTGGISIAGSSDWSGLLLEDLYLAGDYSGNAKNALIDLQGAPTVSDFTIRGCVLDGEGVAERMAFYGGNNYAGDWTWENNEIKGFRDWLLIDNTSSVAPSGVLHPLGDIVFNNNYIHDCYGSISFRGDPDQYTNSVTVIGNVFDDYLESASSQAWAAIEVNIAESLVMHDNSINGVPEVYWGGEGQALQIWGINTIDIHDNSFTNCYQGIWVFGGESGGIYGGPYAIPSGAIYNNTIVGHTDYAIAVESTATGGPLNAARNWWGSPDDAVIAGMVGDNVAYDPWYADAAMTTLVSNKPVHNLTQDTFFDTIQEAID
ncbi:MAG: right-handed parallel beta-helix repeat-containing protein, partial [Dehalococcoidales bacterium]|nr:right-handed parallel beta-helix repeat-containing protein [Dehalococcoidales bacterium]